MAWLDCSFPGTPLDAREDELDAGLFQRPNDGGGGVAVFWPLFSSRKTVFLWTPASSDVIHAQI
jgi:hypothetical protein